MKLQIGETLYDLDYHVNSICHLEELTGEGIGDVMRKPEMSGLRALLWCGLIANNKKLTFDQAGDLLEIYLTEHGGYYGAGKDAINVVLAECIAQAGFLTAQGTNKEQK